MHAYDQGRDVKLALNSIKLILDAINNQKIKKESPDKLNDKEGDLELILKKIRVGKLKQSFIQKLDRGNLYRQPTIFSIESQKQKDDKRRFKCQGLQIDQKILAIIYILDIIFCLVTFVTGAFRAFIQNFTTSGTNQSGVITALMIIAIILTSIRSLAKACLKTIEDGILMIYLTDILFKYCLNFFVYIDLAYISIGIASLATNNNNQGLALALFVVSLLKLFSLYQNLRLFQVTYINSFKKQQYFNLLKVILFNIFFAHFVCSMLLAMSKIDPTTNWLKAKNISNQQWYVQYIWAFYWGCTIIMTVGFGDFTATTWRQSFVIAFIQLFSCIVLAYNISQIGSIISNIRSSQTQYRRKIAIFKRMATADKIQLQLQRRIQAYLKQQTQIKQRFEYIQQSELLSQLPDTLRTQYIVQSNKQIFPDLPFFKNLQKAVLIQFTQVFNGKVYYPGQYLTKIDEGTDSIMILKSGKVGLTYKKYGSYLNGTIVQSVNIQPRQIMTASGQFQQKLTPLLLNTDFLTQSNKLNYDIVAQEYSFALHIGYDDFFKVIKSSEIDSSYYFSIKHKHLVIQNQWQQIYCQLCSSKIDKDQQDQQLNTRNKSQITKSLMKQDHNKYHTKFSCPKLHYFPLNGIIILKSVRFCGMQQVRDQKVRRFRKRQSSGLIIRKRFFIPYEKARNISSKNRFVQTNHQQQSKLLDSLQRINFLNHQPNNKIKQKGQHNQKKQHQNKQHLLTIQKIVRQAIQQALTGYKPDFWQLQIDVMNNYTNYFPLQNAKNLYLIQLGKHKQNSSNSNGNKNNQEDQNKFLEILKNIGKLGK